MKRLAVFITKVVFGIFYRVELVNTEKIPEDGPAILCAAHNTMLDMFFIGYRLKRWVYWMAKEELFKNPISAFIFKSLGAFPVKRGKGDVGSIKAAYKLLQEGNIVGIFPHGTRIREESRKTARIKPGAAMMAVNTGARIIPAAIKGNYKLFSRMQIIFGDPFSVNTLSDKKYTTEELAEISLNIMDRIYSLLGDRK